MWKTVNDSLYDRQRLQLVGWEKARHKYDKLIKTLADAKVACNTELVKLDDPYTRFLDQRETNDMTTELKGRIAGIGMQFVVKYRFAPQSDANDKSKAEDLSDYPMVTAIFKGTPASRSGLQPKDRIVTANGTSLKDLDPNACADLIRGEPGTEVTIGYLRDGKSFTTTIERAEFEPPAIIVRQLPGNLTYIRIVSFIASGMDKEFEDALKAAAASGTKGFVFDVRENGGGQLDNVLSMLQDCLPAGSKMLITRDFKNGHLNEHTDVSGTDGPIIGENVPIVLLVDGGSASASEIFAGGLADNERATLVGTKTFGKGCVQMINRLPANCMQNVTIARYFTPDDHWPGDGHREQPGIAPLPENNVEDKDFPVLANDVIGEGSDVDLKNDKQLLKAIEVENKKLAQQSANNN
jgi:carboxyl-terminal processing protease